MFSLRYKASIKTEWFDTDDPCLIGDYESYYSSITSVKEFKLSWRFRNCLQDNKGGKNLLVFNTNDIKLRLINGLKCSYK